MSTLTFDNAIVSRMMDEALTFCAEKAGLNGNGQVRDVLRAGDCCVCEYMRYGLAQAVARYLGSVDETIQAVYTFEPEQATGMDNGIPGRPNMTPGLSLIARVSRKSAALSSAVASLRTALADECRLLGCVNANALCSDLDFRTVDEDEVGKRAGYGALLSSLYVRPIEVWHR